jgi:hypothetical protein
MKTEYMKQLEPFNKVFEALNFEDKSKTREQLIAKAKEKVIEKMQEMGYTIDSYISDDQQIHSIYNNNLPVYIDYEKLEVEQFIKGALRDQRIAYGSEADSMESLRREISELKEMQRDKKLDKFKAKIEELQSIPGTPPPVDLKELGKQIEQRNRAIEEYEQKRKENFEEQNRKAYIRNFPIEEKKEEVKYDTSKFTSRINEQIANQ